MLTDHAGSTIADERREVDDSVSMCGEFNGIKDLPNVGMCVGMLLRKLNLPGSFERFLKDIRTIEIGQNFVVYFLNYVRRDIYVFHPEDYYASNINTFKHAEKFCEIFVIHINIKHIKRSEILCGIILP